MMMERAPEQEKNRNKTRIHLMFTIRVHTETSKKNCEE